MRKVLQTIGVIAIAGCCLFAQAKGKRLILKDGSYQIVREYKVEGDRVRYFSAERFDWEEIPTSLIDWDKTKNFESELSDRDKAEAASEKKLEELETPTVAPGIRLPSNGGVYLLDYFHNRPELVEMVQNGAEINRQMGKNILRSVINPLPTGPKQTAELPGTRARVQSHAQKPEIYININYDQDDASDSGPAKAVAADQAVDRLERFRIVKVQTKGKSRVVANIKIALTGKMKESRDIVASHTDALSQDWLRLSPDEPLPPGEYAVVEMLTPKQMNLFVFDFGVDPTAPENPAAWKPVEPKQTKTGTDASPVLKKK